MSHTRRRVAITGLGVVSPLGNNPVTFFSNLIAGKSGISRIKADFVERLDNRIAAQAEFEATEHFTRQETNLLDRVSQFALFAARQALIDAALELLPLDLPRTGVYIGTGMGGAGSVEEAYMRLYKEGQDRVKPFTVLMAMNNAAASQIGLEFNLQGPNLTFTTACSSSSVAIGEAYRQIRHGYADIMLAGGSESLLTLGVIKAWEALRALAQEDPLDASASCKPFSANRSGFVLGEGATMLVLEDMNKAQARGAHIYAELSGYGTANDSLHITQPTAEGQSAAMRAALDCAGLHPADIGYINAHGAATLLNDATESAAIKQVFGASAMHIPVSSTKSMHGHLMGAAGAIELVATILTLVNGTLPPTINLHVPDPACNLDYVPNIARHNVNIDHAMSNSFAFGGTGAVLIVSKLPV